MQFQITSLSQHTELPWNTCDVCGFN